jgi:TonB family protein
VTIQFNISPTGRARNPKIIESWPDHRYDQAALKRMRRWRLKPDKTDDRTDPSTAVQTIYFGPHRETLRLINACRAMIEQAKADHDNDTVNPVQPHCEVEKTANYAVYRWTPTYPEQACEQDIGGYATVRFRLGANGEARNPNVIESKPPGVFNAAALEGIRHWHFLPLSPRAPQPGQIMTQTFEFKAPSKKNLSPSFCGDSESEQESQGPGSTEGASD